MADINIEKKRKSNKPVWPWILAALVLVGVIWAIAAIDSEPEMEGVAAVEERYEEPVTNEPETRRMSERPQAQDFVAYVNDQEIKDKMGVDHQVIGEALVKLSSSLENLSQNQQAYSQQIDQIRQAGQEIQSDPQSQQHANKVKDAFTTASNVLSQIKQNNFPDADVEVKDLQEKANKIEANKQLTEQKDKVEEFFEKTADAIEKMEEKQTSNM